MSINDRNDNIHIFNKLQYKCGIRLKKVLKKFADIRKVATFATALRSKRPLKRKETGSEKFLKILAKRFGEKKNLPYLCNRFRLKNESNVLKKSLKKSCKKIWWFKKKVLPLHHFPLRKSGQTKRGRKTSQNRKCSYSNIRTTFFEVIEQLKFLSTRKSDFKQYLWD